METNQQRQLKVIMAWRERKRERERMEGLHHLTTDEGITNTCIHIHVYDNVVLIFHSDIYIEFYNDN